MADDDRAKEVAEPVLLDRLRARGCEVWDDADAVAYLDARGPGVHAATLMDGLLILRPDARRVEAIEEYLHNVQRRVGLAARLGSDALEIHIKTFMIRHPRPLGITGEDATWLRRNRSPYLRRTTTPPTGRGSSARPR